MFTRYDYKAGSLAVNVVDDLVKLLTGTTDKALLSSDAVQATTVIINDGVTRPAGWELFDSAAGTRQQCVRALNFDGVTYKYMVIEHNNTTGLFLKLYESWNATTHVGTNQVWWSQSNTSSVSLSAGGTLFISASARSVVTLGYISGVFDLYPLIEAEHSRDEPWDTVANGQPPYGAIAQSAYAYNQASQYCTPRTKTGNSDLITNLSVYDCIGPYASISGNIAVNLTQTLPLAKARDADFNLVHSFSPILVSNQGSTTRDPAVAGKLFDIFGTTSSYGTSGDETSFDGKTYFILAAAAVRIAIPKF